MIMWLLFGFGLLAGILAFARWYANAPPAKAARALKIVLLGALGGVLLLVVFRGGLSPVLSGLVMLAPLLLGLRGAMRRSRAASGPSPGGGSSVDSAWFEMTLDHDTGAMDGVVRQGPFKGRSLDALSERDLDRLAAECAADPNSRRLLEAYLARRFGRPEADDADPDADADPASAGGAQRPGSGQMSRAEAYRVLGLPEDADEDAIQSAYKRLISSAHPDRGGSAYLAAQINAARQALLGR